MAVDRTPWRGMRSTDQLRLPDGYLGYVVGLPSVT